MKSSLDAIEPFRHLSRCTQTRCCDRKAQSLSRSAGKRLASELGQMSIFLALTFQILFVFFAMVINIGLLVHDKINLQNSVDLAAYYGAQKQAEILNEIAHINYQIRQDYKLLAFRYWVVGTLGRHGESKSQPPPAVSFMPGTQGPFRALPDAVWMYRAPGGQGYAYEELPAVNIAHQMWHEFAIASAPPNGHSDSGETNFAFRQPGAITAPIVLPPTTNLPIATIGLNNMTLQAARQSQQLLQQSCEAAGGLSWLYAAQILGAYREAVAHRKTKIWDLRRNLVSTNMLDQQGQPVEKGVEETLKRNLTDANREGFGQFEFINGLSRGGCEQDEGRGPGSPVIQDILTMPSIYYAEVAPVLNQPGSCQVNYLWISQIGAFAGNINQFDPSGYLRQMTQGEPLPTDPRHSSLGFEKNPWCMAYVGLRAKTRPRKPFAPFGQPIELEAKSFAQPFGGRVGPWYSKTWVNGDNLSSRVTPPTAPTSLNPPTAGGSMPLSPAPDQIAMRVDPLTSPRVLPGAQLSQNPYHIPNYSRYPGDNLGLRSQLAQGMGRQYFSRIRPGGGTTIPSMRLKLEWFIRFPDMNLHSDPLAFDRIAGNQLPAAQSAMAYRALEQAAVAPDLFDVTYYSIIPNYSETYGRLESEVQGRYTYQGLQQPRRPMGDLGTSYGQVQQTANVEDHIRIANEVSNPSTSVFDPRLMQSNYWLVRQWQELLTGWAPRDVFNYSFPDETFAQCQPDGANLPSAPIPGKCVKGGRVGYSVRLISRDHLTKPWKVGGENTEAGLIRNPPPGDF